MNSATFDFAVVGGGPAGLAASTLLAAGGARVLLIDAARTAAFKAGEFIHPKVKAFINRLAVLQEGWEASHLPIHGLVNSWASVTPRETDFIFNPNGPALALDRQLFERQLLDTASSRGVETRLGWTAKGMEMANNLSWRVELSAANDLAYCDARYLLLATGRRSAPSISNVQRRKFDRLAFLAAHIIGPVVDCRPIIECFENGWVYMTPLPGDARVVYVFFDPRLGLPCHRTLESLRSALKSCSRLSTLLDEISCKEDAKIEWFSGAASSHLANRTAGQNWCFLGDLAESRDPLSTSGLFNALRDASRMAAHLLSGQMTGKACEEMHLERVQSFADYLKTRHSYYEEETRWNGFPFWSGKGGLVAS
ncbi:FAD-dependent monooxygenase [Mesorhizobium sp. M1060]|uniref:NAD(P)/FAD-dependent oxidoreductase n=1 Tax=Mesorhizobium sp. M1060 TaxID=2957052 RepID=UPI00333ABE5C